VKFKRGVPTSHAVKLLQQGSRKIPASGDFIRSSGLDVQAILGKSDAVVLERLGIALIGKDGSETMKVKNLKDDFKEIDEVIPEFYLFADATDVAAGVHEDTAEATWGVTTVGARRSRYTGGGIKIGILDSGFDRRHPDFKGRDIEFWSAFGGAADVDVNGHGTHCAGTAAGAASDGMRYGVATEAQLRIYKVVQDSGIGTDGELFAGIERALADGCQVISMSLGRAAFLATASNPIFDEVGNQALDDGSLLVAAAGNSSRRSLGYIAQIDYPANSPTIMAVGALDQRLDVADFSCSAAVGAGCVDIAGPGVDVFSTVPVPRKYRTLSGTSHAAPHVAGVAALWVQSDPRLRGRDLWARLVNTAGPVRADGAHIGAGMVQAP